MRDEIADLKRKFADTFSSGGKVHLIRAPGRVNLIGEHTDIEDDRLALICQKAEHEFAGVPVGIMDQMIIVSAKKDHALLLDCRDLSKQFVPIDSHDLRVVIVNSMVKHELTGGEYAQRRRQCEDTP